MLRWMTYLVLEESRSTFEETKKCEENNSIKLIERTKFQLDRNSYSYLIKKKKGRIHFI